MTKVSAIERAKEIADKVHKLRASGQVASWIGTTNQESQLLSLRKAAAEVVAAISAKKPYESIMEAYEELAAQVDSAGITGLIGESEITECYELIDKLWAAIEKEK